MNRSEPPEKGSMLSRLTKLKYRILLFVLPVIAASLAAAGLMSDRAAEDELVSQARAQLTSVAQGVALAIDDAVSRLRQDLHLVSQSPELTNYLAYREFDMPREAQATLAGVAEFLRDFAASGREYPQVRYIDSDGRELVRVYKGALSPARPAPETALVKSLGPHQPYRHRGLDEPAMVGVRRLPDGGGLVFTGAQLVHGVFHQPGKPDSYDVWGLVVLDLDWSRLLDFLAELPSAEVALVDRKDVLLAYPDRSRVLSKIKDADELLAQARSQPVGRFLSRRYDDVDGERYELLVGRLEPAPGLDWVLIVRANLYTIMQPSRQVRWVIAGALVACIILAALGILYVAGIISKPIQLLAEQARQVARGDLSVRARVPRTQELASLAQAFNHMTEDLALHIEELKTTTAEKERLASELNIAARLQASVLPCGPPPTPGWELAGLTLPARETGGDFFDYLELGPGRVGIVVGDVSGKGLPAALFMLSTRAFIRTLALAGHAPSKVLEGANRQLAMDSGDSGMFVTLFYCEVELDTGRMIYSNAGHNPPLLVHAVGEVDLLERTGLPLGVLEEGPYRETQVMVYPGEALVLYTDGVTEAPDLKEEQWGEARLLDRAQAALTTEPARLVESIRQEVFAFAGDQPQFDDFTLVALRRRPAGPAALGEKDSMPKAGETYRIELTATLEALGHMADFLEEKGQMLGVPEKERRQLEIAADEAITNVVSYAYKGMEPGPLYLTLSRRQDAVILVIEDRGGPFDDDGIKSPDLNASLEDRQIGGLGLFLMDQLMDQVERERDGDINRVTLIKNIPA